MDNRAARSTATAASACLLRHAFLADVAPAVIAQLSVHARCFEAEPDQVITDFEDASTEVYFIVSGHVRVLIQTANGERTQILDDFGAGDLVGEMAAIDGVGRSARIEALVRTQVCVVTAAAFVDAMFSCRELGLRLMRVLSSRIRKQNRRLLETTALPMRLRLLAELLRLSRPRPDGTRLLNPMPTQEELAWRIGARRETVSRELTSLAGDGAVRRTKLSIVLPDPAALQRSVDAGLEQSRERL